MKARTVVALLALLILMVISLSSLPASAAPVRVSFAGVVEEVSGYVRTYGMPLEPISEAEATAALGGSIQIGTPFSGFFVYDDASPISDGYAEGDPEGYPPGLTAAWGMYLISMAVHGEIGSYARDGGSGSIMLWDREIYLDDTFPSVIEMVGGLDPVPGEVLPLESIWLNVQGAESGSPLHDILLSQPIPWDLESFPVASARWVFEETDADYDTEGILRVEVRGALTYLVPEPAGLGFAAMAGCALLAAARRTARSPGRRNCGKPAG